MKNTFATGLLALLGSACTLRPNLDTVVQVRLSDAGRSSSRVPSLDLRTGRSGVVATPADAFRMDCYAVNVNGPGIVSQYQSATGDPVPWDCLQLGAMSPMVAVTSATTAGITFKVPSGPVRSFQMLGVVAPAGPASCDGISLPDLLRNTPNSAVFSLGSSIGTDVYQDGANIVIHNAYDPATELIESCLKDEYGQSAPRPRDVYYGADSDSGFFSQLNGFLPPFGGASSAFQASSIDFAVRNDYARADFVFPTSGYALSQYNLMKVTVSGYAATSTITSGRCNYPGALSSGNGFRVHVYIGNRNTWSLAEASGGSTPPFDDEVSLLVREDGESLIQYIPLDEISGSAGYLPYVHVSVRSQDQASGARCSVLHIADIQLAFFRRLNN